VAEASVWVCGCVWWRRRGGGGGSGGGMGEQRASFRVDRSGGLYQNNTFVDYMTKRGGDKERTRPERISSQACVVL